MEGVGYDQLMDNDSLLLSLCVSFVHAFEESIRDLRTWINFIICSSSLNKQ